MPFLYRAFGSVPWRFELRVSRVCDARRGAFTRFVLLTIRLSMSKYILQQQHVMNDGVVRT